MRIKIVGQGSISAISNPDSTSPFTTLEQGASGLKFDEELGAICGRLSLEAVSDMQDFLIDYDRFDHHDYSCRMGIFAAKQAVEMADWPTEKFDILAGCSRGPTEIWEQTHQNHQEGEILRPQTSPLTTLGTLGFALADFFGQTGLAASQSVTCSSGFHAILHGLALLRAGMSTRVLAGGAEAPLTPFTLAQLQSMRILAQDRQATYPCQPFSATTTGMVVGEGAAFFGLSTNPQDEADFEILGLGYATELHPSLSGITRNGEALQLAMQKAIAEAGKLPDLIIPHAPGTRAGDAAEFSALKVVFGDQVPPVYSAKWATGHTFGASGPLALHTALDILAAGQVPTLPYSLRAGLQTWSDQEAIKTAMINATGFGGNAVSLLIGK